MKIWSPANERKAPHEFFGMGAALDKAKLAVRLAGGEMKHSFSTQTNSMREGGTSAAQ